MHVLMTADTVGGVWRYALELVDALADRDVEVTLATMGREPDGEQQAEAAASRARAIHSSSFALEWMDEPWDDVERAGEWLLDLAERERPDLVHLNGYAHAALPWGMPVVVVAHSDFLTWHLAVRGSPAGQEWERYRAEVQRGVEAADVVVSPTRAMLAALERQYTFACERCVIPNGRRPLRPLAKESLVVAAGRLWDEAKNAAGVERVAPRLPWPVAFARGDVAPDELARLLGRASIFCSPARYEPFGLTVLEAASAGCALVLGDIESLREVWDVAAVYAEPDDERALEAALRHLMDDGADRVAMAERAAARARLYSPERMAASYSDLYGSLVRSGAEAAA